MKYWDRAWSLVGGCSPCSPGCEHCWAASWAHRFIREGAPGHTSGVLTDERGRFNGAVVPRQDRLDIPLHRKKPTVYCIWNDLFHEDVPDEFRVQACEVMAKCEQHTFLVLTKRASEMSRFWVTEHSKFNSAGNVWHGLTVCNQEEAYNKLSGWSISVPGKKFISIEPMLGPVSLDDADPEWWCSGRIDAVILGGETGHGARPMHPDWVRSVRDQCAAVGVPFLFKQWGRYCAVSQMSEDAYRSWDFWHGTESCWKADDPRWRMGSKKAGRLLDGRTHDDMPWREA